MNHELLRILVALDGSGAAETILAALMPLARDRPVDLVLVRVIEPRHPSAEARKYLEEAGEALKQHGLSAVTLIGQGRPAEEILRAAQESSVDLIAMATHGRTGMPRVLFGSVTEEVLRRAMVPLLVGRPGTPHLQWKRILVALDGSEGAETVLPDAARLARALHAKLELAQSIFVPALPVAGLGELPVTTPPPDPMPYLRRTSARLAETFGVKADVVLLGGAPAEEIVRHARKEGVDLICLTTHGRAGLRRVLLGSVAEQILRNAPCAVLVRRLAGVAEFTAGTAGG